MHVNAGRYRSIVTVLHDKVLIKEDHRLLRGVLLTYNARIKYSRLTLQIKISGDIHQL
jgi:hypothetical protein